MSRRGENIRKRKDGRWEGRYYTQDPQTGQSSVHSVYAKTYGEVKERLSAAKQSAKTAQEMEHERRTLYLDTVAEEWLSIVSAEKKYATYIKYRTVYEKHIREKVGKVILSGSDSRIWDGVVWNKEQEVLSDSLQKSIACVLNQIFDYAALHHNCIISQYVFPRKKKHSRPVGILDLSEQTRLLRCLYDRMDEYKLGIVVCIFTGLRLGEICSLKWRDIDLDRRVLHVNTTVQRIAVEGKDTKTVLLEGEPKSIFSKREIPLPDELVDLLIPYRSNAGEYVINRNSPMEPRTYQNKFHRYLRSAGIKRTNFHVLRHTFATNCVNGGMDIKSLSEILGHSNVRITLDCYTHPTLETKRQYMNSLSSIYGQILGQ